MPEVKAIASADTRFRQSIVETFVSFAPAFLKNKRSKIAFAENIWAGTYSEKNKFSVEAAHGCEPEYGKDWEIPQDV